MTTSSVCGFNRYISDTGLVVAQGADFARRAERKSFGMIGGRWREGVPGRQ
jgi:hypothetical protein